MGLHRSVRRIGLYRTGNIFVLAADIALSQIPDVPFCEGAAVGGPADEVLQVASFEVEAGGGGACAALPQMLPTQAEPAFMGGQGECHARNAKFWMSANTRTLVSAPFHKFLVPCQGFFSFLSI